MNRKSTTLLWRSAAPLYLATCLIFGSAAAQEIVKGNAASAAQPANTREDLRAAAAKIRADGYNKLASRIEQEITQARVPEDVLLSLVGGTERIAWDNQTDAPEGKEVFDAAVAGELALFANIGKVELFKVFDAASAPMRHNTGEPGVIEGAHAEKALVGRSRSVMLWGPFHSIAPGRYLVVYRFQYLDEVVGNSICFLDASHKTVTYSGRRPAATAAPAHVWNEIAVPLGVPQNMQFEFRFWPEGKQVALDRIYLYRLADRTEASSLPPISVMGAAGRTGFYSIHTTNISAEGVLKMAECLNTLAHRDQFTIWRRDGDAYVPVPLQDENTRETQIIPGDIIWIPERNSSRILRSR